MNTSHLTIQGRSLQQRDHLTARLLFMCEYIKKGGMGKGVKVQTHPLNVTKGDTQGRKMTLHISMATEDDIATNNSLDSRPPQTQPDSSTRSHIAGKQDLTRSLSSRFSSKQKCSESVEEKEQRRKEEEKDGEEGMQGGGVMRKR